MASPLTMGSHGQQWAGGHSHSAPPTNDSDEYGIQVRPMGLKVHYTFDRDSQVNCLARWPQILQIQAIPLDERNWIGVVDLKLCLQALAQCSPEIVGQLDTDYTVYAYDYSEPDMPLVGQGMLSWALETMGAMDDPKPVTGRVTRNLLAIFGNGIRETLEVRLKLTAVPRMHRAEPQNMGDMQQLPTKGAPTPTDTTEWNSFIQSNPALGRSANVASVPSPNLGPYRNDMPMNMPMDSRSMSRPSSAAPAVPQRPPTAPAPMQAGLGEEPTSMPTPVEMPKETAKASRPSSRASRSRVPTGRPRGRPRKKPLPDGNTSAAEEQPTDADEGPKKKRAKITKADYPVKNPLDSAPDSLRVAASISGSLRTMRPVAAGSDAPGTSHLQEAPRVPTPVPQGQLFGQQRKKSVPQGSRRESVASYDGQLNYPNLYPDVHMQMMQGHAARSPTESFGHSPDNYTPEDSPADLGSSPPVPKATPYLRSSPPPSSPILPPMPRPQPDSGFMSGGIDDVFDDEDLPQTLPQQPAQEEAPARRPRGKGSRKNSTRQYEGFPFQVENPGPPELLPVSSIYNPPNQKSLNARSKVGHPPAPPPQLQRSHTEPAPRPELHDMHLTSGQTGPPQMPPQMPQELPYQLPQTSQEFAAAEAGPGNLSNSSLLAMTQETHATQETQEIQEVQESQAVQETQELPAPVESQTASMADQAPIKIEDTPTCLEEAQFPVAQPEPRQEPQQELQQLPQQEPQPEPQPQQRQLTRAASTSAVPASDPPTAPALTLPPLPLPTSFSEAPCPPSDMDPPAVRMNKNLVKKQTIKERLEKAIESGEMPPFCQNCGAIETPTWRKMWTQDHEGIPGYYEYSEKPGMVTAIDVLERDAEGRPLRYRLVKKTLNPVEDKSKWTEMLLCNPCGIWLAKFKSHRPRDRWEKDAQRLNQPRRKRESKGGSSRSKKSRTKSDPQVQLTSEAYFTTDPIGPADAAPSPFDLEAAIASGMLGGETENNDSASQSFQSGSNQAPEPRGSPNRNGPGSTHSRGSGTVNSPIAIEDDLGATRRLLFPSPRKDGELKVLSDVSVNTAKNSPSSMNKQQQPKGKENMAEEVIPVPVTPGMRVNDDMADLFGTPPARPSTPPPQSGSPNPNVFKTPTRATPSHRPITRSISKSIRSVRSIPKSPSQALLQLQRTPSKTPRSSSGGIMGSASKNRRTPGRQNLHAHFAPSILDSPFTATLNLLVSEANDFTAGSPAHGLVDFDLTSLPNLDSDAVGVHATMDFGNYLSTDMVMPSSPPMGSRMHHSHHHVSFGVDSLGDDSHLWSHMDDVIQTDGALPSEF